MTRSQWMIKGWDAAWLINAWIVSSLASCMWLQAEVQTFDTANWKHPHLKTQYSLKAARYGSVLSDKVLAVDVRMNPKDYNACQPGILTRTYARRVEVGPRFSTSGWVR